MTATIIRSDTQALPLADASVDLVVTSPPYWALRSYTDGGEHYGGQIGAEATPAAYVDNLLACTREWVRVLKPSGSLWINLGDKYSGSAPGSSNGSAGTSLCGNGHSDGGPAKQRLAGRGRGRVPTAGVAAKSLIGLPWRYAIRCIDELGLILRAEVVWSKPNGLPESVTDRVRRSHETWFHFTKSPRYFAAVDAIREPHSAHFRRYAPTGMGGAATGRDATQSPRLSDPMSVNPLGKLPGSVWEIATQPLKVPAGLGIDHFAAFPMEWPRRIIRGWSPEGGTVLDPFGGTGTTALVADVLGRRGVSVDMSADYCRLASWRTTDRAEIAKALCVAKPHSNTDGQIDLFGEVQP